MKAITVLTGVTSGIGKSLVNHLLKTSTNKIIVGIKPEETFSHSDERLKALELDLRSFNSVREFASNIVKESNKLSLPINTLINNAAIKNREFKKTKENFIEEMLQVNYLSPVLLTHKLIPSLLYTNSIHINNDILKPRIIHITCSNTKERANFEKLYKVNEINEIYENNNIGFNMDIDYSTSKTLLQYHTMILDQKLKNKSLKERGISTPEILTWSTTPSKPVNTPIHGNDSTPPFLKLLTKPFISAFFISPDSAIKTSILPLLITDTLVPFSGQTIINGAPSESNFNFDSLELILKKTEQLIEEPLNL